MEKQEIKRKFVINRGTSTVKLEDPDPTMAPSEVMSFYANHYPELNTSTVQGPELKEEDGSMAAIYTFKTVVGTKG